MIRRREILALRGIEVAGDKGTQEFADHTSV